MKNKKNNGVFEAIRMAAISHHLLTAGTILCVAASVVASLLPPLLLAGIIDRLTAGIRSPLQQCCFTLAVWRWKGAFLRAGKPAGALWPENDPRAAVGNVPEAYPAARKHAGRPEPRRGGGTLFRRCGHGGSAVHLRHHQHGGRCLPHHFHHGSHRGKNTGIALVLLLVLPLFAVFTRHVQKRMLAAQLDNRRAVAAVSGQVPETLHNIRTIRALGLESYRERRYDRCIGESYAAMERTNFTMPSIRRWCWR